MRHSKMVAVTTTKIEKSTNKWIGKLLLPLIALCIVFGASTQTAKAIIDSTACGYSNFLNCHGEYIFYKDGNGNPRTSFLCDEGGSVYDREGHQRGATDTIKGGLKFDEKSTDITGFTNSLCIAYPIDDNANPVGDTIEISAKRNVLLDFNAISPFTWIVFEWADGTTFKFDPDKFREIKRPAVPNVSNYIVGKALVYPNPTDGAAFVKLDDNYVSTMNVKSVVYELYNSDMGLITTLTPNSVGDIMQIPANYISTNATYYVVCCVEYLGTNGQLIVEKIKLQFVKSN